MTMQDHDFMYEEVTIPVGMTITEYRRSRSGNKQTSRTILLLRKLREIFWQ
jgi:hypothetical protein